MKDMAEVRHHLVQWLGQQVEGARVRGLIFGLSGGLDSAVVAALSKEACPDATQALIMPCFSQSEDVEHAKLVAEAFDVPYRVINLDQSFIILGEELESHLEGEEPLPLAKSNLKPRLRMTTLYYYAAQHNYLVVGTSNKSELTVGYFTKYGDGGVDLQPLATLVKSEVRDLATLLGVPQVIIDKAPSGGLWPGQTDEDELGLTYAQLDGYLLGQELEEGARNRIEELFQKSEHKRKLPPIPCLKG